MLQVHKAQDIASKRGKLLTEDFLFLIRKVNRKCLLIVLMLIVYICLLALVLLAVLLILFIGRYRPLFALVSNNATSMYDYEMYLMLNYRKICLSSGPH